VNGRNPEQISSTATAKVCQMAVGVIPRRTEVMLNILLDAETTLDGLRSDSGNDESRTTITSPTTILEEEERDREDDDQEFVDDPDFELDMANSLDQLAEESFHARDFAQAEGFLQKRLSRAPRTAPNDPSLANTELRIASCQLWQGRWDAAARILSKLGRQSGTTLDPVLAALLHFAAIGFCSEGKYQEAERCCKLCLQMKRKVWGRMSDEYHRTSSLLVKIAEHKGDHVEAQALRRTIPPESGDLASRDDITGADYFIHPEQNKLMARIWASTRTALGPVSQEQLPAPTQAEIKEAAHKRARERDLPGLESEQGGQELVSPPNPYAGPNPEPKTTDGHEDRSVGSNSTANSHFILPWYTELYDLPEVQVGRFDSREWSTKEVLPSPLKAVPQTAPPALWPEIPCLTKQGVDGKLKYEQESRWPEDLYSVLRYASFLELCKKSRVVFEQENPTDTFKEVCIIEADGGDGLRIYPVEEGAGEIALPGSVESGRLPLDSPGEYGPRTFAEMGIRQGDDKTDCLIM
jgi:tetratricopeptide (TPR) repeat protein